MFFLKPTLMTTAKLSDISTVLKIKLHGHVSTRCSAVPARYLQPADPHFHAQIPTNTHVLAHIDA